jgi:hypothetical protein
VVHHRVRGADHFSATSFSPNGINWGHYSELRVRDLLNQAQESFDSEQQTELLAQAHAIVIDDRLRLHRARSEPTCDVAQGQGLAAGAELVSGFH